MPYSILGARVVVVFLTLRTGWLAHFFHTGSGNGATSESNRIESGQNERKRKEGKEKEKGREGERARDVGETRQGKREVKEEKRR